MTQHNDRLFQYGDHSTAEMTTSCLSTNIWHSLGSSYPLHAFLQSFIGILAVDVCAPLLRQNNTVTRIGKGNVPQEESDPCNAHVLLSNLVFVTLGPGDVIR
eukprot:1155629-Pelagomonas_calceolata.AAC.5